MVKYLTDDQTAPQSTIVSEGFKGGTRGYRPVLENWLEIIMMIDPNYLVRQKEEAQGEKEEDAGE